MKQIITLLIVIALCLSVQVLVAQTNYTVKLYFNDSHQSAADSLTLGANTAATFGFDPGFGEVEMPPAGPTGVFDVRFLSPRMPNTEGFGTGKKIDIRQLVTDTQRDTFVIKLQCEVGNIMNIWWQRGLSDIGIGGLRWDLQDMITGTLLNIDMGEDTSIAVDVSLYPELMIVRKDGAKFRTVSMDSLARAVDSKGKGKAQKMKPVASHWTFSFKNTGTTAANKLTVKFGQTVTSLVRYSPFTLATGVGTKEVVFTGAIISPGASVVIEGYGDKGKPNKAKGVWGNLAKVDGTVEDMTLLLPKPNWHNMGEELYTQGAFGAKGLVAGIEGNAKSVIHPKYKDVQKTLFAKGKVHDGAADCLSKFVDGKPITKEQKSLPAAKHNNRLLAEQLTLKFNLAMYDEGKVGTPYGLGELIYIGPVTELYGKTVSEIAEQVDAVLSCDTTIKGGLTEVSYAEWHSVLKSINDAFSSKFDTVSWAGKLVVTADVFLGDLEDVFLLRTSGIPPKSRRNVRPMVEVMPEKFELLQNYPNPFNPTTTIEFTLPEDANVTIKVFNMLGQEVAVLANNEEFTEGANEVEFDASHLSSGVYFYRITVNNSETGKLMFTNVKKMLMVK